MIILLNKGFKMLSENWTIVGYCKYCNQPVFYNYDYDSYKRYCDCEFLEDYGDEYE